MNEIRNRLEKLLGHQFYFSDGSIPEQYHLRNKLAPKNIEIPNNLNGKEPAFGHLHIDSSNVYWLIKANHSETISGHKCIRDIYDNVLTNHLITSGIRYKCYGELDGKEVTLNDVQAIANVIKQIDLGNLTYLDLE